MNVLFSRLFNNGSSMGTVSFLDYLVFLIGKSMIDAALISFDYTDKSIGQNYCHAGLRNRSTSRVSRSSPKKNNRLQTEILADYKAKS